jgi:hypothetical protein
MAPNPKKVRIMPAWETEKCRELVRYTLRKGTTIEPLLLINITRASIHAGVDRPP